MREAARETCEDAVLGGRVRLLQPVRGHRAGTDAVLLAAAAPVAAGETVVDVGAATGAVGLMIRALKPGVRPAFVERDPDLALLCRRNVEINGAAPAPVIVADILDRETWTAAGLQPEQADCVATNPPFLDPARSRLSPDPLRMAAHALPGDLGAWLRSCAALLRPKGRLALIHRADYLATCLASLPRGFGGTRVTLVHPRSDEPAVRLILTAVKGSRAPLSVAPPLVLHDAAGRFTSEAAALHRGDSTLA